MNFLHYTLSHYTSAVIWCVTALCCTHQPLTTSCIVAPGIHSPAGWGSFLRLLHPLHRLPLRCAPCCLRGGDTDDDASDHTDTVGEAGQANQTSPDFTVELQKLSRCEDAPSFSVFLHLIPCTECGSASLSLIGMHTCRSPTLARGRLNRLSVKRLIQLFRLRCPDDACAQKPDKGALIET